MLQFQHKNHHHHQPPSSSSLSLSSQSSQSSRNDKNTNLSSSSSSWSVLHTPKLFADLQLHHTKRKALLHWLTTKASLYNPSTSRKIPTLVLYGSSGIGKSSAMELLCHDVGITMTSWQQDMIECDSRSFTTLYSQRRQEQSRQQLEDVVAIPSKHHHRCPGIVKDLFQVHYHESGRREVRDRQFNQLVLL